MDDYLIIGAGINGLLTARELAATGARVTLIDRGEAGRESSWAGGGIVSPLYPWRYPAAITALASWAQAFYPRLAAELADGTGIDVQHHADGLLMLDAQDEAEALAWAGTHSRLMRRLPAAAIYRREPALAPGFERGLWMPEVAHVRNPRLCRALLAELRRHERVRVREYCEVTGFSLGKDHVRAVTARQLPDKRPLTLLAQEVVITTGAWSSSVLQRLLPGFGVMPVKGQMLLFRLPEKPLSSIVLTAGRYLIPRQDGHLLAGSTLEFAGFDKRVTAAAGSSLLASARVLLPALARQEPVAQWAGLRPGTADGIPFIGRLESWRNVSVNAGQYRNGLVLAPASARLLADILLARTPIVDPQPYRPERPLMRARVPG